MSTTVTYKGQTLTTAENQTKKLLTAGKYLEDDVTIQDITQGGAVTLVMGAIRPDAELVQSWTADEYLVDDLDLTIPAYSTSEQTLVARGLFPEEIPINTADYDYFYAVRALTIPVYDSYEVMAGLLEYGHLAQLSQPYIIPANTIMAKNGSYMTSAYSTLQTIMQTGIVYWNNSLQLQEYSTQYGPYVSVSSQSIGSTATTLRMSKPGYFIRGHATYFKESIWGKLTDIRFQYVVELYRAPKHNLNLDGWGIQQETRHVVDCTKNNNWTLT